MNFIDFLTVAGLAALPVSELRGALPLAYFAFHWPLWLGLLVAAAANALTGAAVFLLLEPVSRLFRRHIPRLDRIYADISRYAESRHRAHLKRWQGIGLFIIVALPLPVVGGAWIGALLAHITQMPKRRAVAIIIAGVIVSGLIIAGLIAFADSVPALLRRFITGRI